MKTFVTYPGTLGLQYKPAKELTFTFEESSLLVIHSDGLTAKWSFDEYPGLATHHPALIAAVLFRDFKRENDDATVLVLRRAQ